MSLTTLAGLAFSPLSNASGPAPVSLPLALGAGVLSTLHPCGFALLSAYITYTVKQQIHREADHQPTNWHLFLHGGLLGLPLIAGFLLVFLGASGILALGGRELVYLFPWLSVLVGAGFVFLGGWTLLTGQTLSLPGLGAAVEKLGPSRQARPVTGETRKRASPHLMRAAWAFGVGYGLSSLGCTLPVFLLVVGTALTTSGMGSAMLVLATYAAGMALVLLTVAIAAAQLGDLLRSTVVALSRWTLPLASLLLIASGISLVVYQLSAGLW